MQRWTYLFGRVSRFRSVRPQLSIYHHGSLAAQRPVGTRRASTITSDQFLPSTVKRQPRLTLPPNFHNLFPRDQRKDARAWISLLEPLIPSEYRTSSGEQGKDGRIYDSFGANEVAGILAQARHSEIKLDILHTLGEQGRWKEVIWLVTYLVDNLWHGNPYDQPLISHGPWSGYRNLDDTLQAPLNLDTNLASHASTAISLEDRTSEEHPLGRGRKTGILAGHNALGEIWQSLGNMILADSTTGTAIRPEILQIIALLHTRGIMPKSIYDYSPLVDRTTLQQPPLLHLLSSHIMTSLSDAAWRAHEDRVVQEDREKADPTFPKRPEIPASVYRVRVGGLRHEVWLELILWACIHGGWTTYGSAILDSIMTTSGRGQWQASSWRKLTMPPTKADKERTINWDQVRYALNTGAFEKSSDDARVWERLRRTISSEVVTAYLDGMISLLSVGVGLRGTAATRVVEQATKIKNFLQKRSELGLESTSWDAIVQRLVESQSLNVADSPALANKILSLASSYGEETRTRNFAGSEETKQPLWPYVVDGTAAALGIAHRVIQSFIEAGDVMSALRAFESLQFKVDRNKRNALEDFFKRIKRQPRRKDMEGFSFESPYARMDYPSFYMQLPVTLLAPLMDLITDAGAMEFGNWLLRSNEPDGPVITEDLYSNLIMAPALIRFAAASDNAELLQSVLRAVRSSNFTARDGNLQARWWLPILESQLFYHNYDQAAATLQSAAGTRPLSQPPSNQVFALIIRECMSAADIAPEVDQTLDDRGGDRINSWDLFRKVVEGPLRLHRQAINDNLVLTALVNDVWKNICARHIRQDLSQACRPSKRVVNTLLSGIVDAYGSDVARAWLERIWHGAREEDDTSANYSSSTKSVYAPVPRMPREVPDTSQDRPADQTVVTVSAVTSENGTSKKSDISVIIKYRPSISTIRKIIIKARQEVSDSLDDSQLSDAERQEKLANAIKQHSTLQWCVRMLRRLGKSQRDAGEEVMGEMTDGRDEVEAEGPTPEEGQDDTDVPLQDSGARVER